MHRHRRDRGLTSRAADPVGPVREAVGEQPPVLEGGRPIATPSGAEHRRAAAALDLAGVGREAAPGAVGRAVDEHVQPRVRDEQRSRHGRRPYRRHLRGRRL